MVDRQRARVEDAMKKFIDDLDRSQLRKMQADMHKCAARCCEDTSSPLERVHGCVEDCSIPLSYAQKYVQTEIGGFQDRLQRCVMQCNDDIRDKMGPNPSESEASRYTGEFEVCATKCVDKNLEVLSKMFDSVKKNLLKGSYPN
ncbi:Hypothetical predicted protein [Cloeon dipterum]|uniref:Protein FAM136A n=1 Tax=Cloeon dipterum TaxID=197152 RepID=A0A8S1CC06_9INSE|nr:Hypothetical predicted protein [Cloeon dipterum]